MLFDIPRLETRDLAKNPVYYCLLLNLLNILPTGCLRIKAKKKRVNHMVKNPLLQSKMREQNQNKNEKNRNNLIAKPGIESHTVTIPFNLLQQSI